MSYSLNASSNDDRVETLKRQHQRRQSRFFIAFALIEGFALAAAVVVVYLLELVDPDQGIWLLVAIAAIGGFTMSMGLLSMNRRHAQEMRDLTGH